jgi:sporulation-control protein spo0M
MQGLNTSLFIGFMQSTEGLYMLNPHGFVQGVSMGILSKVKAAGSAMTGGAAKVSIDYTHQSLQPGDSLPLKVTIMSMGKEVKSGGVFVDIQASEAGNVRCKHCGQSTQVHQQTIKQAVPVGPAFVLQPNETKVIEATVQLPMGQPSYSGQLRHEWKIRGRLDAFGNDPDSGFQVIEVR